MAAETTAHALTPARQALAAALARHGLDGPGSRVLLAASGGSDSAGLLAAFAALPEAGRPLALVAHVDHGLHPAAARAAQAVRGQAERLGLPLCSTRLGPGAAPGLPFGSEAWSRAGRYRALARMAREAGAKVVLTAHQREDRVETLLMRLLRGAGTRGLGGIPELRPLGDGLLLLRPLLELPRRLLAAEAERGGLVGLVVEDPTNSEQRFLRNSVRHRLLPELCRELGAGGEELLAAVAGELRRAAELQARCVAGVAARLVRDEVGGGCRIATGSLLALPEVLQAAFLLDLLHRLDRGLEPRRVHVQALLRLARHAAVRPTAPALRWCLPGGSLAATDGGDLVLFREAGGGARRSRSGRSLDRSPVGELQPGSRAGGEPASTELPGDRRRGGRGAVVPEAVIQGPGRYPLPELGLVLSLELLPAPAKLPGPLPTGEAWFDVGAAPFPWTVRPPRTGETMVAFGEQRQRSVEGLLRRRRVPAGLRRRWPLLLQCGQPLWLVGLRRSARAPVAAGCLLVARVQLTDDLGNVIAGCAGGDGALDCQRMLRAGS